MVGVMRCSSSAVLACKPKLDISCLQPQQEARTGFKLDKLELGIDQIGTAGEN